MKPRHAAALALVGWYLLEPPFVRLPNGQYDALIHAPLSKWYHVASLDSARDCEIARQLRIRAAEDPAADQIVAAIGQYCECIATDDPRLKENRK